MKRYNLSKALRMRTTALTVLMAVAVAFGFYGISQPAVQASTEGRGSRQSTPDTGTQPPATIHPGDHSIGFKLECEPELSIHPRQAKMNNTDGYEFKIAMKENTRTCGTFPANIFRCYIRFYPNDGSFYTHHQYFGWPGYVNDKDPQVKICEMFQSREFLKAASTWRVEVWSSLSPGWEAKYGNQFKDGYTKETYNVRTSDGAIIHSIPAPIPN